MFSPPRKWALDDDIPLYHSIYLHYLYIHYNTYCFCIEIPSFDHFFVCFHLVPNGTHL